MTTPDFRTMKIREAIEYCLKHRDQFIADNNVNGRGEDYFQGIVDALETGIIKPEQLPAYNMVFPKPE